MYCLTPRFCSIPPLTLSGILVLFAITAPAHAATDGYMITPIVGYTFGGEFDELTTGQPLRLAEATSYGLVFNEPVHADKQTEFYYSFQPSRFTFNGVVAPELRTDIDIEYFHFGNKQYLDATRTSFVVGTIGATRFDPDSARLGSETRFSIGLGGGLERSLSPSFGLRMEGRAFATFLDRNGPRRTSRISTTPTVR